MKEIIQTVIEKLKQDIPQLRYIAEDWGQLEFSERPVQFPCALIDLDGFKFQQMGQQAQTAEGDIYIRIADEASPISANAPDRMHQRAYAFYDLLQQVHNAIHGLSDNQTFQQLIQTSLKRVRHDTRTREYILTFHTAYFVQSNLPQRTAIVAKTEIKTT